MSDRRLPDRLDNDRRQDFLPTGFSAPELISLALEGACSFRLEEMLDRIEARP